MDTAQSTVAQPPRVALTMPAHKLRWRFLKDRLAAYGVLVGGLSVIGALLLIFVYLLSEVLPMFRGAQTQAGITIDLGVPSSEALYVGSEEQNELGIVVQADARVQFYDLNRGDVRRSMVLPTDGVGITQVVDVDLRGTLAAGLDDGRVLLFRHSYRVSYPDDVRLIEPGLEFPLGETPIGFADGPLRSLIVRDDSGRMLFSGLNQDNQVLLKRLSMSTNFLGEVELEEGSVQRVSLPLTADRILVNPLQDWLYAIDSATGALAFFRIEREAGLSLLQTEKLGGPLADARHLSGGVAVLFTLADGRLQEWFPARNDGEWYLAFIREFSQLQGSPTTANTELRRRAFAVGMDDGRVAMYYAAAGRQLLLDNLNDGVRIERLAYSPRAQLLMMIGADGKLRTAHLGNPHPEVSMSALWGKVWYESHDEPKHLWQSSSASADFEPKFSLYPLTFGTLKAAFYAMMFAVPLALFGAIYTANFMAPKMRQMVKPTVEVMEALPTVILGFLAGLWLAPFIEKNLAGIFLTLILLPVSVPLVGYLWGRAPLRIRQLVPPGWEAALMVPTIALLVWLCFSLALPVEIYLFGGNMQGWMDLKYGIDYDQRNSLVVGIAMGIAVIPTIFSIAEDAIFGVPKHLSQGSLALGATPWQTLVGVVLPTASPGMFSAVMIGMGRAVGETMIVLMATGNTAVTDWSIFQGMRTLSANIAVEMPESEIGSTHFRLLFLAGLVLFIFTFVLNTLAELVRQRLRKKYAAI